MTIPGSANPLLLASAAAAAGGYTIERSVRFNSADSAYLSRTPASAGNRKTWTWAGWVKRSALGTVQSLFSAYTGSAGDETYFDLNIDASDKIGCQGWFTTFRRSTQVFRDCSAWYHIAISADVGNATANDRIKLYVNGSQITTFDTANNPASTSQFAVNAANGHAVGGNIYYSSSTQAFNGYLADIHFIDGQALDPTSFGEFDDNGIWQPIEYTGDYGLVSVVNATGALPVYNTTDTYGTTKGTGTRTDTNASSLVLAIPMDGANNGTTFTDESATIKGSGSAKTISRFGNTKTSTAQSKFYGSSGFFDGTGDYLQAPAGADFSYGTGDFTFEAWIYPTTSGVDRIIYAQTTSGNNYVNVALTASNTFSVQINASGAGNNVTSTGTVPSNAWTHIAVTRQSTVVKLFINGVQDGSGTRNVDLQISSTVPTIGTYSHASTLNFAGYIQDFRVYKGVAKYTSNFTPVVSSNNSFHLPFDDNSTAAALGTDTSGNGNTWTVNNIAVGDGPVYSLYTTASPGFNASYPVTRMFDSSESTEAITSNASGAGSITFTPATAIAYTSSVEVYNATGPSAITATLNGGSPVTLTSNGWNTVASGSGSITSLVINRSNGAVAVGGIRINGSLLLVDGAGSGNDSLVDVPTNGTETDTGLGGEVRGNYAVLLDQYTADKTRLTMANGNLDVTFNNGSSSASALSSIAVSSGKWYSEFTVNQTGSYYAFVGIASITIGYIESLGYSDSYAYVNNSGNKSYNGSSVAYGATWTAGDVIGVALDLDAGTLTFYKNGTSQGQAYSSISGTYIIGCTGFLNWRFSANFGQRPFAYTAPSGFKALCTANLPAPVVTKPSTVMDVALWTGNGGNQSITLPGGFNPDLVWVKSRSNSQDHYLFDAIRGGAGILRSNTTGAETTGTTYLSFDTSGFSSLNGLSTNNYTYAGWCWDAGSSTVTNTDGSITSSVRANPSAGFSVVTFNTGASGVKTVGHGLNVAPQFFVIKSRSSTGQWAVYHAAIGYEKYMLLHSTSAAISDSGQWVTSPTSSVFTFNSGYSTVTNVDYVGYFWASVSGYSSFGSYTGNGSADGPFVYTGFRPKYVLIKRSDSTNYWIIQDGVRNAYNVVNLKLAANTANAENDLATIGDTSQNTLDFLSNGFKCRTSNAGTNTNAGTYVWAAFAENPFQYARAR